MKKKTKMLLAVIVLAIAAARVWFFVLRTKTFDLNPYINVSYEGYSEDAVASFSVDTEALAAEIQSDGKEADDEKLAKLAEVLAVIVCNPESIEGVSNGQELEVTVSYDKDLAKSLGYRFTGLTKKFTAEGLEEKTPIDPFDAAVFGPEGTVLAYFEGSSPLVELVLENNAEAGDPLEMVVYQADRTRELSKGDKVTITASFSEAFDTAGYKLTSTETTLTVDGVESFVSNIEELSLESRAELLLKLTDVFNAEIQGYVELILADGNDVALGSSYAECYGSPVFAENGSAVVTNSWGSDVLAVIPFTTDINDAEFSWWANEHYDEPTVKTFAGVSGYCVVRDLMLDINGNVIISDSLYVEMSDLFEDKAAMVEEIMAKYGDEGIVITYEPAEEETEEESSVEESFAEESSEEETTEEPAFEDETAEETAAEEVTVEETTAEAVSEEETGTEEILTEAAADETTAAAQLLSETTADSAAETEEETTAKD